MYNNLKHNEKNNDCWNNLNSYDEIIKMDFQSDLWDPPEVHERTIDFFESLVANQNSISNENVEMEDAYETSEVYWDRCYKILNFQRKWWDEDYEELEIINKYHNQIGNEISNIVELDISNGANRNYQWPLWFGLIQFNDKLLVCENENCINLIIPSGVLNLQNFYYNVISAKNEHIEEIHQGISETLSIKLSEIHEGIWIFDLHWIKWGWAISIF